MQKPVNAPPADVGIAPKSPAPRRPRSHPALIAAGFLLAAIVAFALLFQWNWLRGPLASAISARIHRPVRIAGNLQVHPWSWTPTATLNDLIIGNPSWAGRTPMVRIPRLTVQARLKSLLWGPAVLPLVQADRPVLALVSDARGRQNWRFGPKRAGGRTRYPLIEHLVIRGGVGRFTDLKRRIAFAGAISADERAPGVGAARIEGAAIIGAAPWAGPTPVARAPHFLMRVSLLDLLNHRLVLPLVEADSPSIRLLRDAAGRESWTNGPRSKPLHLPPIRHLVLKDGALRYDDEGRKLRFTGTLASSEQVNGAGRGVFHLIGRGVLNTAPFAATITGGSLVNVDKTRPYPFVAEIAAGPTRARISGRVAHPFDFGQLAGTLRVTGPDMADLYHLTGLVLPTTPPYDLSAGFARRGKVYALTQIRGRVGDSDLAGRLTVDHTRPRPLVTADLASRYLELSDLVASVGAAPRHTAGHTLSPAQRAISARLNAEHRLFPDTPLGLDHLKAMDAKVTYSAAQVRAGKVPVRGLALKLDLANGVLALDPLDMTLPQGRLLGLIRIDARTAAPSTRVDLGLSNARLEQFVGRGKPNPPLEGGVYARAQLTGLGNSVRQVAASANGAFAVVVPQGEIRQALAELLGINATKGLFLLISKNQGETPIRCAVADFRARNGVLQTSNIVLDTGVVLARGGGRIDLRDETIDLTLSGKPKKFRRVRIAAPITVTGRLDSPHIGVEVGKAAPQLAAGAALGALVAPLAVILPFVAPGLAHNADCPALIAAARVNSAPRLKGAAR
ncbi:MAG: AsmA family protein [Caulobacteraceae bacterium]